MPIVVRLYARVSVACSTKKTPLIKQKLFIKNTKLYYIFVLTRNLTSRDGWAIKISVHLNNILSPIKMTSVKRKTFSLNIKWNVVQQSD